MLYKHLLFNFKKILKNSFYNFKPDEKIINQISSNSFCIIENFFNEEKCNSLINDINRIFDDKSQFLHKKSDTRLYGIQKLLKDSYKFTDNIDFTKIASQVNSSPSKNAFTMANILNAGNTGSSGEGWHRDAFFAQFKAMIYLTDVNEDNGPLQIFLGSHKIINIIKINKIAKLNNYQNRINNQEFEKINSSYNFSKKLCTLTAKKGSLILFDSTSLHRGKPIKKGKRIALTNYYYPNAYIENNRKNIEQNFHPILDIG